MRGKESLERHSEEKAKWRWRQRLEECITKLGMLEQPLEVERGKEQVFP